VLSTIHYVSSPSHVHCLLNTSVIAVAKQHSTEWNDSP